MSDLEFEVTPAAREYCDRIIEELMRLFGIGRDEAVGRMNRHWEGQSFLTEDDVNDLTRESPDFWAQRIYYQSDVKWWIPGEELRSKPYP